jgi:general stress protein YciG
MVSASGGEGPTGEGTTSVRGAASDASASRASEAPPQTRGRGFAAMDRDTVREVARRGGMAAHQKGRAHEFTVEEARIAGRKGALAHRARRVGGAPPAPPDDVSRQDASEASPAQVSRPRTG